MRRVIICIAIFLLGSVTLAADESGEKIIVKKNAQKRKGKTYSIKLREGQLDDSIELFFDDYYDSILDTTEIVRFNNKNKNVDRFEYFGIDFISKRLDYNRFWGLLYKELYYRNFDRVDGLVEYFSQESNRKGWSRDRLLTEVVTFVQRIEYLRPEHLDIDNRSPVKNIGLFTPNQVLFYEKGDCDSKSLLLVMLLKRLGYDAVILLSTYYSHAIVAINHPGIGGYYRVSNNIRYYTIEATAVMPIGDMSDEWADMSKWTIIRID